MKIKHIKGSRFWHVCFNDQVISGFYSRREAKEWMEENRHLENMVRGL